MFWVNVGKCSTVYAGGAMTCADWNLNDLKTDLTFLAKDLIGDIEGITSSFLYAGAWGTFFANHVEDMQLGAINYYVLSGAPKTWYVVPPSSFDAMAAVISKFTDDISCAGHMNRKQLLIARMC